jgi:predicted AAA+ superfamily ATPase
MWEASARKIDQLQERVSNLQDLIVQLEQRIPQPGPWPPK